MIMKVINKAYRNIFYSLFLVIIVLSFSGCNSKNPVNSNDKITTIVPTHLPNTITASATPTPINQEELSYTTTPTEVTRDYEECFDGFNGCAVIYNVNENEYNIYNEEMCNVQTTPCSTFKIISTLMGLQNNVIDSEDSKLGYSGTTYPVTEWNSDVTLKEAFQYSCIWYYRKVIDKVGRESVQEQLDALSYGNCDISSWEGSNANSLPDLNGFWLESSLKISPTEQVNILTSIFEGKTNYSVEDIEIIKHIMKADNNDGIELYGKTGAGINNNSWYVGFFEANNETHYFAVHLNDATKSRVTGADAKQITLNIINKFYMDN
jgi:bla regulator protein BlaR1